MEDYKKIIRQEYVKCANDPVYFLKKYTKISHKQRGKIPFNTFKFQDDALDEFKKDKYKIILKGRQLGLSTLVAGYILWIMIFQEEKEILCVATKQSTAKKMVTMVKYMYESLPSWLSVKHEIKNELSLQLINKSMVTATSSAGDAGRSDSLSLLVVDEAAFISNVETIWTAAQGTLSTGGDAIVLSTPNGTGNWFHKMWVDATTNPKTEFTPIKLKWDLHPERDQAWRDRQDVVLKSKKLAAQENDCDFSTSGDLVFEAEDIKFYEETFIKEPMFKRGMMQDLWVWEVPDYSRDYMVLVDVARGDDKDNSTFHVIDVESNTQVAEYQGKIGTTDFGNLLVGVATEYNNALLVVERENVGWAVIQTIIDREYDNLYYSPKGDTSKTDSYFDKYADKTKMIAGWSTNLKTRPLVVGKLVESFHERSIIIQSSRTIEEMKVFIWKEGKAQAQQGYNDDLIIPLGVGMYLRDTALILRQRGIEMANAAISGIRSTRPQSVRAFTPNQIQNPYGLKMPDGSMEDLRWLIKRK